MDISLRKQINMARRMRAIFDEQRKNMIKIEYGPAVSCEERKIETPAGDTSIFIYFPKMDVSPPYPVYISIHGGGFILGSPADDDRFCRLIANKAGCVVINVEYHLAPEYKFPVAVKECYAVAKWVFSNAGVLNIDPQRIAIGGYSAGGNLSAVVCLLTKERGEFQIIYQVLAYPVLDQYTDPYKKKYTPGKSFLQPDVINIFNTCYHQTEEDAKNPLVSPIYCEDLRGLPPTLIIAAEDDMLCNEDKIYAKKLIDAGVTVLFKEYAGCDHAFTHLGPEDAANDALDLVCTELRKAFYKRAD